MSDEDLCFTPATELASMIARRALSPVELMQAILARIDATAGRINAFAYLDGDRAMDAARESEQIVMDGGITGPLHGIPFTIKDLAVTREMPTERGSLTLKGYVHGADAPFIPRLEGAGAIALGKTTTSEFGWTGVSRSPSTGITSNPWGEGLNAGASSAGAGAGAAAGYGPLHQGSDGAGSVRMPAHFCGVFGLKPTFGRIPNWPVPNNDQTSHVGTLTRTVSDAALMLECMAGPYPLDHWSLEGEPEPYTSLLESDVSRLRVAWSPDLGHARVDPEVAALVLESVRAFEAMGVKVEEVTPEWGPLGPEIVRFTWPVHEQIHQPLLAEWESRMDPGLVACIRYGAGKSADDYLAMRGRKLAYTDAVHRFFEEYDLLLTPSVSVAAFPATRLQPEHWPEDPWDWISWAEFSYPFNFSGNPAASVPAGFTDQGLPVGIQIVGRRFDDLGVLRAAKALETARPWADRRPPL